MNERLDVPYGTGSSRDLCLDIYSPSTETNQRTAVLMLHGGGWRAGSRKSIAPRATPLQALGFTAIPVEYRLLGEAPFPSAIHDTRAAIRWVRANAGELNIDPDRIVLQGFSAGAHLSLLTAGTAGTDALGAGPDDTRVAAVIAFYPPTSFYAGDARHPGGAPIARLLDENTTADDAAAASPITYVSANYPPTFFLHGGADRTVSPISSVNMHQALKTAGAETDLHIFAGQLHEFDNVDVFREVIAQEIGLFLRRMVSAKEEVHQRVLEQSMFARRAAEEAMKGVSS